MNTTTHGPADSLTTEPCAAGADSCTTESD